MPVSYTHLVCNYGHTTLQDTIYNLIDRYIPKELHESMTIEDKTAYITKWQLYISVSYTHLNMLGYWEILGNYLILLL